MELSINNKHFEMTFKDLQFVCNSVLLNPTQQNLDKLNFTCNSLHQDVLQHFFKYILVPLVVHLNKKQDDVSCRVLNSLSHLLRNYSISSLSEFFDVYLLLLAQLQDIHKDSECNMSEELKLSIVKCISILMKNTKQSVREEFLHRKYYSKLSPGIFLCTKLATAEKYIALKVEALNCLMHLTLVSDECKSNDFFHPKLAEVLMLMIPGITGTCIKIINSSDTLNHKPIVLALELWSRVLAVVLSSKPKEEKVITFSLKQPNNKASDIMQSSQSNEDFDSVMKNMSLNEEWIKKVDGNLAPAMQSVLKCQNNSHWKVRLAVATASNLLLTKCGNNLSQSVGFLIETLVFLSQDEKPDITNYCKDSILRLSHQCESLDDRGLVGIIEENFYSLLTKFPRILHGADITLKERQLVLISGFLDILGEKHLPAVLSSLQHLNRFLHCLMMCATPDCSRTTLIEDVAVRGLDSTVYSEEPTWRHLKFCETVKSEDILQNICCKLVKYSDLEILLNNFLDEFNSNEGNRKSITLLFIFLFSSGELEYFISHPSLLKDLVETLMDQSLWDIPTCINEEVTTRSSIQENIVKICLLSEAVGSLSVAAGPSLFLPYLLQCLYPILECAGNPLSMISSAGLISLNKLACLYDDSSISTLIAKNVDYLSHHVTHKLRKAHRNPRVLSVLTVIMEYSSFKTLPSLHDIINDVLIQSCDLFQDINGSAFLHVFHTYLTCIKKWIVKKKESPTESTEKENMSIVLELVEYKRDLEAAEVKDEANDEDDGFMNPSFSQFSKSDEEPNMNNNKQEKEEPLPDHIILTRDILSRSLHFLPANNITRQILVLQILQEGVKILIEWQDVLLPAVHKIWSPLVNRFKTSSHPLLLQRAFSLLMTLARHSKDFIRARTVNEVLPVLCKVLADSINESKKADRTGMYFMTQKYKLQLILLSNLGKLSRDLELNYKQVYSILIATTQYLSRRQPQSLQVACIELYTYIGKMYNDLVWSHLMTVCPDQLELKAPFEGLCNHKVDSDTSYNRPEYSDAVCTLLQIL